MEKFPSRTQPASLRPKREVFRARQDQRQARPANSQDGRIHNGETLRLGDYVKDQRKKVLRPVSGTVAEARVKYEKEVEADHTLKDASKLYRTNTIKALLRTWPGLDSKAPAKITETECREWASKFAAEYDDQFFNNTLSSLRHIFERAGIPREENPAFKLKRLGVKPKELRLPEANQFAELLGLIETAGARQSQHCADLVRFLAFSGCRISEANQVRWADVDFKKAKSALRVQNAQGVLPGLRCDLFPSFRRCSIY